MEKRGVVEPGRTPELGQPEKKAAAATPQERVRSLDDSDFSKQASDRMAERLKNKSGS